MGVGVRSKSLRSSRGRLLTTLITCTLVVAACGGGEESADESVSPESSSPDQPADSIDSVPTTDPAPTTDPVTTTADVAESSDTDVTVTSDDGILEVFVPAGSGPADVTIEMIEQIDVPDATVPVVGYELGPDGATYSEPVTLTFSLPADEWSPGEGVPVITFASDAEDVPIATTSRDGDIVTVVANVDHFTEFYVFGTAGVVFLNPPSLAVPVAGEASSNVSFDDQPDLSKLGAESAMWSVSPEFTVLRDATFPAQEGKSGLLAQAFVTCDSSDVDPGLLNVELVVSNQVEGVGLFDVSRLLFSEPTSNIVLSGRVECVGPIEPIEQDCLTDGGTISAPEEFGVSCVLPELVLPGVDPFSLTVELPEGSDAQKVIVSLSGGEDPATETLMRFPLDGPPFAFFSNTFLSVSFDIPLSVSIIEGENGFEISDLPIIVTDSVTLLQVPAGTTSDGTPVLAAEVPLTGLTIEIGNQSAVATSIYEAQTVWF